MTDKEHKAACACCVLHELDIICRISRFNQFNKYNPYSVLFADDFRFLFEVATRIRKELDSYLVQNDDK